MFKISIITVNLNNLSGLQKTAESILNQSLNDFEFIIIDGGSTDGSKEYITSIGNRVNYWVSEPDTGIYNAMNKGIEVATGEYLCFLNSGDLFFDAETLAHVAKKVTDSTIGIYYGDVIFDEKRKRRLIPAPVKLDYPFLIGNSINHQSSFIKRSLFDEIFYYNENLRIIADWEFVIYAVCKKEVATAHLGMVISIYDASGVSSIQENQKSIIADRQKVIETHFPLFNFKIEDIETMRSKRGQQFLHIRNNKLAYRVLKWFLSVQLLFTTKFNYINQNQ